MAITRRQVLAAAALTAAWPQANAADQEHAVFRRVKATGEGVLFGYVRIAATLVPDITNDGRRLIDETQRLVLDFPSVQMPSIDLAMKDLTSVWRKLSSPVVGELRPLLAGLSNVDEIPAFVVCPFLTGEGQTRDAPFVGEMLAEHARSLDRRFAVLIAEEELRAELWRPPDLAALDQSLGEAQIAYLLELRRRVGPIGAHLEQLDRDRRGEEIYRLTADMARHRIPSPSGFLSEARMRELLLDRLTALLGRQNAPTSYAALPLGCSRETWAYWRRWLCAGIAWRRLREVFSCLHGRI